MLKPIVGEIKAQVLNDNFSYINQKAEEAGTDPELEQKVNNLIARIGNNEDLDTTEKSKIILAINEIYQDLMSHKAEKVTDAGGVHGLSIEYGTFTPELRGSTVAGNHVYAWRTGEYYRIGRMVKFKLGFSLATYDPNTEGLLEIYGLPFVRGGTGDNTDGIMIGQYSNITLGTGYTQLSGFILNDKIALRQNGSDKGQAGLTATSFKNGVDVRFSGVYLTN